MYPSDETQLKTIVSKPEVNVNGAAVLVPLAQAGITGLLSGVAVGVMAAVLHFPASALLIGVSVWSVVTLFAWLGYRRRWQNVLETWLGLDLNNDGWIGEEPAPAPQPLRVELVTENGTRGDFIDIPYAERLPLLAEGLLQGKPLTLGAWTGTGAPFSRSEFEQVRTVLIMRGLARWKNPSAPAQGAELSPAGKAVFKRITQPERSPTLPVRL